MTDPSPEAREFDLADILSVTTGRMVSHRGMPGIHEILDFLTGDMLMTHQLPRAAEACRPALLEQYPALTAVTLDADPSLDELRAWLAAAEAVHGVRLPVSPIANWERRNPLAEFAEMNPTAKVVVVVTED